MKSADWALRSSKNQIDAVLSRIYIHSHCKARSHNPKGRCACREKKKKKPCFRSHILCPRFEHNYFTKLDYVQKKRIGVKQFVLKLSYRPLHTFSRTLSCSMDANLVVDRRWAKYQIKLFTISQLLNLNPCCTYKKLPACKTAKILAAFLILPIKINYCF